MRKEIVLSALLFASAAELSATTGEWAVYPALSSISRVELMGAHAFVQSGLTLCVADTSDLNNASTLSRLNGLNGTRVFDIAYSPEADRLAVVYADGNIDVISPDLQIQNLPDFKNKTVTGDRTITAVGVDASNLLIRTGIGILVVDLREVVFRKTESDEGQYTSAFTQSHTHAQLERELNASLGTDNNLVANAAHIALGQGRLITVQASHPYEGYEHSNGIISILNSDQTWFSRTTADVRQAAKSFSTNNNFYYLHSVAVDPNDPHRYAVSNEGNGIFLFQADTLCAVYNPETSEAITPIVDNYARISGLHFDQDGNLWFTNCGIDEDQLRCITTEGDHLIYPIKNFTNTSAGKIDLLFQQNDENELIWLIRSFRWDEFGGALYYRGLTDFDKSDDQSVTFSSLIDQDGNTYNPQYLYGAMEDLSGAVWLLTSAGPFVVSSPASFFNYASASATSGLGSVTRIKIPRNDGTNLADYLLPDVEIHCGVVDAANRKWLGTASDGLYLISADGLEQLAHFTTDNSPLFTNDIQALEYDASTGMLYIATEGGICTYHTDAIEGASSMKGIYCYPNPVRPEYTGKLTIGGLMDNSQVRITDTGGNVVHRAISAGGMLTWDLNNTNGTRVKPGVYIIHGVVDSKGETCKVLVL